MKVLERYWWPTIALIYPLVNIFWVIPPVRVLSLNLPREVLTVIALLGGAFIEWRAHPELRLGDIVRLPYALWKHPVLLFGFGLAIWVLTSALFSADPAVSLTGSLSDGSDSAISYIGLVGLMIFTYLYYQRNPLEVVLIWDFIIATGAILSMLALVEVVTMWTVMSYPETKYADFPFVTFKGNGHLAGYLALVFAGTITKWFKKDWSVLPVMALLIFTMAVCFNRTSVFAAFLIMLLGFRTPKLLLMAILVLVLSFFSGQKFLEVQRARVSVQTYAKSENSFAVRSHLIKAGVGAILDKPIFGFGGALFSRYWYQYLSKEELTDFLQVAYKWKLEKIIDQQRENILFAVKKSDGSGTLASISAIKVHNQFVDVGVMWGVPGLIFYTVLIFFGLRNIFSLRFESFALLAYVLFSLTWFFSDQAHGIVFILIAVSQVNKESLKDVF
jgi:hypothetical protein